MEIMRKDEIFLSRIERTLDEKKDLTREERRGLAKAFVELKEQLEKETKKNLQQSDIILSDMLESIKKIK